MKGNFTGDLVVRGDKKINGVDFIIRVYRHKNAKELLFEAFPIKTDDVPVVYAAAYSEL